MEKVINIPEEVVNNVQLKEMKYRSLSGILTDLIDTHSLAQDTSFMHSPVVQELQNEIAQARKDWDDAKDAMALQYIDKKWQKKLSEWTLNYGTNELTLVFRPGETA